MSGETGRVAPVAIGREHSRRNFLKTAAWGTAALSAAGIGGFSVAVRKAWGQGLDLPINPAYKTYQDLSDVQILQFAYLLELLEGTFYARGVQSGLFAGGNPVNPEANFAQAQIAAIRDHEMAHADTLATTIRQLGGTVPQTPTFNYPQGVFQDPAAFLDLAATFEPVGIGAYQGAAPTLDTAELLTAALTIHNIECRHRVAINILQGVEPPNNLAFEDSLPLQKVQQAVKPFGVPV